MEKQLYKPVQGQPTSELRFVLYVRKSTEDEGSQINSIEDQIRVCREYAENRGDIRIVGVVKEETSAKRSGNRPRFDEMLRNFPKKYEGLVAYHPDRLARNMREAGVIIDMLNPDNGLIKNLAFPTVQFSNDSSGRLTLAVLFSLATQFSEHLSETVKRGVDSNLQKGKSAGVPKWGYLRSDITGLYEPDENFPFIKAGWDMRADGATIEEIVEYWNKNNVHRKTKITRKNKKVREIRISQQMASKLFTDPFNYGILCQAGDEVDLRLIYNFKPVVSEEVYNIVQTMRQERHRKQLRLKKRLNFYPLRGMAICDECDGRMVVGPSTSRSGKRILYFRCGNKECHRQQKSVRASAIFEPMYEMLDKLKFTKKDYEEYSKTIEQYTDEMLVKLREERKSLIGSRNHKKNELADKSRSFTQLSKAEADTPQMVLDTLRTDLETLQNELIDIDEEIGAIEAKIGEPSKIKLTKDEFLNLANSLGDKMRAGTPVEKDILCRMLFLNLRLDNKNAPSYLWKEPFASLIKSRKINFGARERT